MKNVKLEEIEAMLDLVICTILGLHLDELRKMPLEKVVPLRAVAAACLED